MMSRMAGTAGTLISEDTLSTAGRGTSSTSTSSSRVRSTSTIPSPAILMPVTLFSAGTPSTAPTWTPTSWKYRSLEPMPHSTRSYSPTAATAPAMALAVWRESWKGRLSLMTSFSASGPRERISFWILLDPSAASQPTLRATMEPPPADSCLPLSSALRSYWLIFQGTPSKPSSRLGSTWSSSSLGTTLQHTMIFMLPTFFPHFLIPRSNFGVLHTL